MRHFKLPVSEAQIAEGLRTVEWPARHTAAQGKLRDVLPRRRSSGSMVRTMRMARPRWRGRSRRCRRARPLPLVLILGMMNTREPRDFLEPFKVLSPKVLTLPIPGEPNAHPSDYIASEVQKAGFEARAFRSLGSAMSAAAEGKARVVIGGSLYLAGHVLHRNGTPPH